MKSLVPKSKTMRVATALTGITACTAGFVPTAAQAAPAGGLPGKVPLPAHLGLRSAAPEAPAGSFARFWIDILFRASVYSYQVCGPHLGNVRRCTAWTATSWVTKSGKKFNEGRSVGGNLASWIPGQVSVRWNGGGAGRWDYCNPPASYVGAASYYAIDYPAVWLWGDNNPLTGIGAGIPRC